MKRFGFTLAEVLITLGIIGVISALTLPSLLNDTQGAQVGPRLGKAVSMFEQANQALLEENNVDSLSDGGFYTSDGDTNGIRAYATELSNHLKITQYRGTNYSIADDSRIGNSPINNNGRSWITKDGTIYHIAFWGFRPAGNVAPHNRMIGVVVIDINGNASPNLPGTDVFAFSLRNDGSLVPVGSFRWNLNDGDTQWQNTCANDRVPTAGNYYTCTASIFENNMKVLYKMR